MNENIFLSGNLRFLLSEQAERFKKMDSGHPREILDRIRPHLKSPHVIVITGLRRCGKSTLQAQLARAYFSDDYYYLNFDDERWTGFEAADFSRVHESLLDLFGERHYFLMDEVQNIPRWELFVRRLHDAGHKLIITGSNASLRKLDFEPKTTAQSAQKKRALRDYLKSGGLPDALKYPEDDYCAQLYQDIIYRDISARHSIDSLKNLKEMSLFLVGNAGRPVSFNKLRQMLMLGSVNTVKTYMDYLEASWLFLTINVYSASVKQQQIAPKKVYCIDNGIIHQVAFRTTDDAGWLLENTVFLHLRRQTSEIYYARNDDGSEVDFLIRKGGRPTRLIQAAASLRREDTRKREAKALLKAMERHKVNEGIRDGRRTIHVVPATKWLG